MVEPDNSADVPNAHSAGGFGSGHYLATGEGPFPGKRIKSSELRADGSEVSR